MVLHVTYAPGDHALLGAGNRWLLLDAPAGTPGPGSDLLNGWWEILASPARVQDRLLSAVEESLGADVSLVWLDTTPGAQSIVCRGAGRCTGDHERRVLRLDEAAASETGLRVASGVVAASCVVVRPAAATTANGGSTEAPSTRRERTEPPAPIEGLIDGIPDEVLTSRGPTPSSRTAAYVAPERTEEPPPSQPDAPSRPVRAEHHAPLEHPDHDGHTTLHAPSEPPAPADEHPDHDGHTTLHAPSGPPAPPGGEDHDGQTTHRPSTSQTPPPSGATPAHLSNPVHETVLAVHCPSGHTTPASTSVCRVCGVPVAAQEPVRVPRPRLGSLRLPDGQQIPLDRAVLFGRAPSVPDAPELGEAWPHLVRLPSDTSFVSRTHLLVELKGWMVVVTDLGSRGGTTLRVPGRTPERIRAREEYVWEPGQVFDLADSYEILYEVGAQG